MAKQPPQTNPGRPRKTARPRQLTAGDLPSREDIVAALATEPGIDGKRDLAKYFGIHGDLRIPFKLLLKDLEAEGIITRSRKTIRPVEELPAVTVLDIPPNADPEDLFGHPVQWAGDEALRPRVRVVPTDRVVPGPGDRILARIDRTETMPVVYTARPMKVLDKPRRAQIGIVRLDQDGARLIPVDRKQKEMRIEAGDLNGARDGDLVEVEIKVTGRLMIPKAKVTGVVGNPRSEGAVSLIAIHSLEIPYRFPASVLKEAEEAVEADIKGREDWRHIPFVTIDPVDAKDHDDAVYAEPDEDEENPGGHIVYVAIADVAAYVRPGTGLDREAYLRGNSVYFPDRVVPMLPERISNELGSLKEGSNKAALAVRMVIASDGRKRSHSFHRILFRSAAKLNYAQAQAAIDGTPDDRTEPLLSPVLRPLWDAYRTMVKARDLRQPLALDLPERRVQLDDKGMVQRIYVPERLEAHKLIEEMMIAANVAAAETLEQKHTPLVYRVHDGPSSEKLQALRDFLGSLDLSLTKSDAVRTSHFNQVLEKSRQQGSIDQVSEMVLRSQAQAEYSNENYGHFGLNLERYAHFTSPIRRYADLIVHRALITALGFGKDGLSEHEIPKLGGIGQHISMTERRAMMAERETTDRLLAYFLSGQLGAQFTGRISGVTKSGLFVRLTETGADGFIPASTIGADYYRYVEEQQAMIGERTGERYGLGDTVDVRLVEAAPVAGALRFELLSGGTRVNPSTVKRGGRRPSRTYGPKGRKARR